MLYYTTAVPTLFMTALQPTEVTELTEAQLLETL